VTEPRDFEPVVDADVPAPDATPVSDTPEPELSTWRPVQPAEPAAVDETPAQPEASAQFETPAQAEPFAGPEPTIEAPAVAEPVLESQPPAAQPEVVPAPLDEPESVSVPEPEPVATPEPEPVATPEPESAPVPEPVAVPEPAPTQARTPEPQPVVAPEPELVIDSEPTTQAETVAIVPAEPETAETVAIRPVAGPPMVEPTIALPNEPAPTAAVPTESIFRPVSPSQEPTTVEQLSDEEAKLAAERAARRDARVAALAATAPMAIAAPAPVIVHKRTNDKFWGSLGLFLLRLVVAVIFAIRGLNIVTDIPAAQATFAKTILPEPQLMAIVTGVASLLIALSLVLGLLTRLAGLGIALIAGGVLAFVLWGPWSPFVAGQPGFLGEFELLLAAVGLLFLLIGGGGWSLDRSFRAGRERDKAERNAAS